MKRQHAVVRRWFSAAFLIVAGSVFAGCMQQGGGRPTESADDDGIGGLAVGASAPEITAPGWINGDAPTAADIKGKVVVVVESWAYT